jgi:hypothetical protein
MSQAELGIQVRSQVQLGNEGKRIISMNEYRVFEDQNGQIVIVKKGWSWPGFLFTIIWLFFNRMWEPFIISLILSSVVVFISDFFLKEQREIFNGFLSLLGIIVSIIFGINGNKWRQSNLISKGFAYKITVKAPNKRTVEIALEEENSK